MNFSAVSQRSALGRLLRSSLKLIPSDATLPILQGSLKGRKWIAGSSNHGCWLGSYEYCKRRAFERVVREGAVVYDIGAHVGFYTLLASVLVGARGKVFAFEPHPRNLSYLRAHLKLNAVGNVVVIEKAVSEDDGVAPFAEGANHAMGHLAADGKLQVETASLDGMILRREIPPPAHIKIDVEGAELRVLAGAKSMLSEHHPTIFLATHGDQAHRECCQFLASLRYELRPLDARSLEEAREVIASDRCPGAATLLRVS